VVSYGAGKDPQRFTLPVKYVAALRRAGATVFIVPPGHIDRGELDQSVHEIVGAVDGLLLPGGGDLQPSLYSGLVDHPALYGVDPARDELELALVAAALSARLPLLGICRGLQVVNVALGGDLIQHLPDVLTDPFVHRLETGGEDDRCTRHAVRLDPASTIARLHGRTESTVQSYHHQAIGRLAPKLRATAWTDDGTIEAIEVPGQPEVLCVQWHPELAAEQEPMEQRLFDWLVGEAAGVRRRSD
jgi:putative glutamine amidotransferase